MEYETTLDRLEQIIQALLDRCGEDTICDAISTIEPITPDLYGYVGIVGFNSIKHKWLNLTFDRFQVTNDNVNFITISIKWCGKKVYVVKCEPFKVDNITYRTDDHLSLEQMQKLLTNVDKGMKIIRE